MPNHERFSGHVCFVCLRLVGPGSEFVSVIHPIATVVLRQSRCILAPGLVEYNVHAFLAEAAKGGLPTMYHRVHVLQKPQIFHAHLIGYAARATAFWRPQVDLERALSELVGIKRHAAREAFVLEAFDARIVVLKSPCRHSNLPDHLRSVPHPSLFLYELQHIPQVLSVPKAEQVASRPHHRSGHRVHSVKAQPEVINVNFVHVKQHRAGDIVAGEDLDRQGIGQGDVRQELLDHLFDPPPLHRLQRHVVNELLDRLRIRCRRCPRSCCRLWIGRTGAIYLILR
mmetsp:Transcript_25405/g.76558  ORF Transcript_25405/g.76558 Transcript_25405/m.76558 type:complete len:284 (-) Transcript_25405:42-893(-)